MEEDVLLDISDEVSLFGVHYIFVPRLRADLDTFTGGWNNHPLRTEGGLSPEQLWYMGHQQDLDEGESLEVHKYKKDSSQNVYIKKVKLQKFGRHICLVP